MSSPTSHPAPGACSPCWRRTARSACSAPASAPTGASTSTRTRRRSSSPVRRGPASATCSTGSPSTSRCACTAASASTPARSTRCSGHRSSSTPSTTSATCCTRRAGCATGCGRCRHRPRTTRTASRPRRRPRPERGRRILARKWPTRQYDAVTVADVLLLALGAVATGAAALVVTTRHVVRAGLWLVVTLGAVAGLYLVLTAELVAWVQVLLYVGAGVGLAALFVSGYRWSRVGFPGGGTGAQRLGEAIFGSWVLPFEVLSVLLLAALIGAIVVSRPDIGAREGR